MRVFPSGGGRNRHLLSAHGIGRDGVPVGALDAGGCAEDDVMDEDGVDDGAEQDAEDEDAHDAEDEGAHHAEDEDANYAEDEDAHDVEDEDGEDAYDAEDEEAEYAHDAEDEQGGDAYSAEDEQGGDAYDAEDEEGRDAYSAEDEEGGDAYDAEDEQLEYAHHAEDEQAEYAHHAANQELAGGAAQDAYEPPAAGEFGAMAALREICQQQDTDEAHAACGAHIQALYAELARAHAMELRALREVRRLKLLIREVMPLIRDAHGASVGGGAP